MSNLHRIQWLDAQIRSLRYPNSTRLAAQFCISTRQAGRDIEYLKYSLGAPLAYSAEKRGYYYSTATFSLPALFIGTEEKAALGYLAEQYRTAGHQLATQLANLFTRLSGQELEQTGQANSGGAHPGMPVYAVDGRLLRFVTAIKEAVAEQKKIRLLYLDSGQNRTERIVHPYLLFRRNTHTYLQCFCETRQAERSLRIDRVRELTILSESFRIPAHFDSRQFTREDFRFNYRLPYRASIRFDAPLPPAALAEFSPVPLHPPASAPADSHNYSVEFYQSAQLLSGLVLTGIGFTILTPAWLRQRCCRFLSLLVRKNS